jgi:hypothetical protein
MSDQVPPPDQPTPPPAEGVAPDAGDGATPPPPPPDETAVDAAPPPPPEPAKRSRKGLLIGVVAGVVVLLLIAGALTAYFTTRGPDKHSITVTSTAGGMKRDKAKEAQIKPQLDATVQQFKTQFKDTSVTTGLYNQDTTSRGPKGELLFVGFKFLKPSDKNPDTIVKQLRAVAVSNQLDVTNVATGDAGGKAVCLASKSGAAQKTASCIWITRDSGGGLFPDVAGYDAKQMSKLMADVRSDVEKTE